MLTAARAAGRMTIQATQATPTSDATTFGYTDEVDLIIRYPHLQFYAASPQEALERFGPRANPRRMLDMDIHIIETCQKRAGSMVDFAGFVRENAPKRLLFHSALHPNGELTAMLLRAFAGQIPGADQQAIDCAAKHLARSEGINSSTFHPVNTAVLAELGFDWGPDYEIYRSMMEQRSKGEWGKLLADQELYQHHFGNDTWCWLSLTQAHTEIGSKADAERCLNLLLELSPGNLHSWLAGLTIFMKHNDYGGLGSLVHRARSYFQGQRIFSQLMAYIKLATGQYLESEPWARDYYARTPDRGDGLVPLLIMLSRTGKDIESRQIIEFEVSIGSPARIAEVRANLSGIAELAPYLAHLDTRALQ